MRLKLAIVSAVLIALTFTIPVTRASADVPATKPMPKEYDLNKVTCKDLLQANILDRASAVMFLWGFEAGRRNVTTFTTDQLESATRRLMATCEDKPSLTLFAAVAKVSSRGK